MVYQLLLITSKKVSDYKAAGYVMYEFLAALNLDSLKPFPVSLPDFLFLAT